MSVDVIGTRPGRRLRILGSWGCTSWHSCALTLVHLAHDGVEHSLQLILFLLVIVGIKSLMGVEPVLNLFHLIQDSFLVFF